MEQIRPRIEQFLLFGQMLISSRQINFLVGQHARFSLGLHNVRLFTVSISRPTDIGYYGVDE